MPEAFRVQRVSAFLTEHQLVLRNAVHGLITNGTVILGSRNTSPRVRGRQRRRFTSRARIRFAHVVMGESIWCLWGVRKYALKFANEQRPTNQIVKITKRARVVYLTFDTTDRKTVEPEGLSDAPCAGDEHIRQKTLRKTVTF